MRVSQDSIRLVPDNAFIAEISEMYMEDDIADSDQMDIKTIDKMTAEPKNDSQDGIFGDDRKLDDSRS